MKIGITGPNGFIGTKIRTLMAENYEFLPLSRAEGMDITTAESVEKAIENLDADWILHLAAYTNVDEAEKQKEESTESLAWQTNVVGAENIANAAKKYNKKLIHVSTDMVFGANPQEWYHEQDTPAPVNFYGETKYKGEQKVLESGADATILRIAYPFTFEAEKRDYVRIFLGMLKEGKAFSSVADGFYAPTYIEDIPNVLKVIIDQNLKGIIHATSGEKLSGFEIAQKIAEKIGVDKNLVSPTTRAEFFKDRAPRAENTALFNDTLYKAGIRLTTLDEALDQLPKESLS